LEKINAGFDEDVEAELPDPNPVNLQTSNLFPESQEFNQMILEASNISGLSRPTPNSTELPQDNLRDQQMTSTSAEHEAKRKKRSVDSQMTQQHETEFAARQNR
jgi:hypothetical protein